MIDPKKPRRSAISTFAITGASQKIAGPSEKRRAIQFALSFNATSGGFNNRPLANVDDGFWSGTVQAFMPIRYEDFGDLVCGHWFYFGNVAGGNVVVTEAFEI